VLLKTIDIKDSSQTIEMGSQEAGTIQMIAAMGSFEITLHSITSMSIFIMQVNHYFTPLLGKFLILLTHL
jgi:hypothetical protein